MTTSTANEPLLKKSLGTSTDSVTHNFQQIVDQALSNRSVTEIVRNEFDMLQGVSSKLSKAGRVLGYYGVFSSIYDFVEKPSYAGFGKVVINAGSLALKSNPLMFGVSLGVTLAVENGALDYVTQDLLEIDPKKDKN